MQEKNIYIGCEVRIEKSVVRVTKIFRKILKYLDHLGDTYNTELNHLRIIICLRKSEITVGRISDCNAIEKLMEHTLSVSSSHRRSLSSLTYDSRGAWHTVYAMLLSNYK